MKRKLLATILSLAMCLSLVPVGALAETSNSCTGGENCTHEVAVGETHYDKLYEAIEAANGAEITVLKSGKLTLEPGYNKTIQKSVLLNLNQQTISFSTLFSMTDGRLTVKNGTVSSAFELAGASGASFDGVTFTASSKFTKAVQINGLPASAKSDAETQTAAEYQFTNCIFNSAGVHVNSASDCKGKVGMGFTDCTFQNAAFTNSNSRSSDCYISIAKYTQGTLAVENCSFSYSCTGMAAAVYLGTSSSAGDDSNMAATMKNVTIEANATGSGNAVPIYVYTYTKQQQEKCNTTLTEEGTNSYTVNGMTVSYDGYCFEWQANGTDTWTKKSGTLTVNANPIDPISGTFRLLLNYKEAVVWLPYNITIDLNGYTFEGSVIPRPNYVMSAIVKVTTDSEGHTNYVCMKMTDDQGEPTSLSAGDDLYTTDPSYFIDGSTCVAEQQNNGLWKIVNVESVTEADAVAKIGSTYYSTIQTAMEKAASGQTITLTKAQTVPYSLIFDDTIVDKVTLDLGGFTHAITSRTNGRGSLYTFPEKDVTIQNGTIAVNSVEHGTDVAKNFIHANMSTLTLNNVTVTGAHLQLSQVRVTPEDGGEAVPGPVPHLILNDSHVPAVFGDTGTLISNGGDNKVTIKGGSVVDKLLIYGVSHDGYQNWTYKIGTLTLEDCTIGAIEADGDADYAETIDAKQIADGYAAVANSDGSYSIGKTYTATFTVTPSGATVVVKQGDTVKEANDEGIYTLNSAQAYTYTVTADGYTSKEGTIAQGITENQTIQVFLDRQSSGGGGGSSTPTPSTPTPNPNSPTVDSSTSTNDDGSTVTTETKKDGTTVETTQGTDGSTTVTASKTETKETSKETTTTTASTTQVTTPDGGKETTDTVETVVTDKKTGTVTTTTTVESKNEASDGTVVTESSAVEVVEKTDGTVTTTVASEITTKAPDGTSRTDTVASETTIAADGTVETTSVIDTELSNGSQGTTVLAADGSTTADVTISQAAVDAAEENDTSVTLPMPAVDASAENTVSITLPTGASAAVEVPAVAPTPGTVAMIVNADGTTEVIRKSVADETGVTVPLDGSATIMLVDNAKDFVDTDDHWAEASIDFVTSRELYQGTAPQVFTPDGDMSRAMLAQVLHNLESNPDHAFDGTFPDLDDSHWGQEAIHWAADEGILTGYPDGTIAADDNISREQLAVMLWRYAGSPETSHSIGHFADAGSVSSYASAALAWAAEQGIITGKPGGTIDPQGDATRAEVSTMIMRMMQAAV